jgi:hypothetical protein
VSVKRRPLCCRLFSCSFANVITDVGLLVLDIVSSGEWFRTFWRIVVPLSLRMSSHFSWTYRVVRLKPPAQQNGITSQITGIFNSVTLRTWNPVWYDVTLCFRKALCCWWLRWLTLSVFYRDLLSTREDLDARSQYDNSTSKCGSCCYRQSAVRSWRVFRYGDEFGIVGPPPPPTIPNCHWKWWHVLYNV